MKRTLLSFLLGCMCVALISCSDDNEKKEASVFSVDARKYTVTTGVLSVDNEPSTSAATNSPIYFHEIILLSSGLTIGDNTITGTGNSITFKLVSSTNNLIDGTYVLNSDIKSAKATDLVGSVIELAYTKETEQGERYESISSGQVTVAKSGDVYTIDFTGTIDGKLITLHCNGILTAIDRSKITSSCLVSKITIDYSYNSNPYSSSTSYTYDSEGKLISITGPINFTYENGLVKTRSQFTGSAYQFSETWSYTGAKLSRVSGGGRVAPLDTLTYTVDFVYDGSKINYFNKVSMQTGNARTSKQSYVYSGDNVATAKFEYSDAPTQNVFYAKYDTKHNPYLLLAKAIGNQSFYCYQTTQPIYISRNNLGVATNEDGSTITYSYEYNANGYPSKITAVNSKPLNPGEGNTSVYTFEYINCN